MHVSIKREDLLRWTKDEVKQWLKTIDSDAADLFAKEDIDGKVLLDITENDLKELGLSLGKRKTIIRERDAIVNPPAATTSSSSTSSNSSTTSSSSSSSSTPPTTFLLPRGVLPQAPGLTESEKSLVRKNRYDAEKEEWVPRPEGPLSDEELECWDYQARWLVCPVSGKKWFDKDSIMGVGLYHAPRFLCPEEIQRQTEYDRTQSLLKKDQSPSMTMDATLPGLEEFNLNQDYEVYPTVAPPPPANIKSNLATLPNSSTLGHVEAIIGPSFDIRAYNWGIVGFPNKHIKPQKERGILSMDQQWNAVNFFYWVPRTTDSNERKKCTNRLSFYIEERHGARIFPNNITSQISLLLFRDKRLIETQDVKLFATSIRRVIPKVVLAVINEIIYQDTRVNAIKEREEYALRTYLLVHQVAIKLVLKYENVQKYMVDSVIHWIQSPFREGENEWDLEELLVSASLVGIPWNVLRESFMRKLLITLHANANIQKKIGKDERLKRMFELEQNKLLVQRIMYEFSFLVGTNKSVHDLDKQYARCAGSLPKKERDALRELLVSVRKTSGICEFWSFMGMDTETDDAETLMGINKLLDYLLERVDQWKNNTEKINYTTISLPAMTSQSAASILQLRSEKEKFKERSLAEERIKHRGYPVLQTKRDKLDPLVCNYPQCGKKFSCRDHLFRHLKSMIPPDRMIKGYHQNHFKLQVPASKRDNLTCEACGESFETVDIIHAHYRQMGVPGFHANRQDKKEEIQAVQVDDITLCVVCMDEPRKVVFLPCGHLVCCRECGQLQQKCPMCRVNLQDAITVYQS